MVADHLIAARVSADTKTRLKMLAVKRGVSESALLKDLLDLTLGSADVWQSGQGESPSVATRRARLYVRLRPDDQLLLAERSAARRMPPATYVSVLVRAHLRDLAPLPADELRALSRAVAELGAVGRNLNQIALALNQVGSAAESRRIEIMAMMKICSALRDHVKELLKANAVSWKVGHETSRP